MNKHCYDLKTIIVNSENNPLHWTIEDFEDITDNKNIIGYMFRIVKEKFNNSRIALNLFLSNSKRAVCTYTLEDIQNALNEWLSMLAINEHAVMFKNPPLDMWLDTKDNWITAVASKLMSKFNIDFETAKSHLYFAIVKAYNKGNVYLNSLSYLYKAAINEILLEIRYNRNRLNLSNVNVVSIDALINDDTSHRNEEFLGKEDDWYNEREFEDIKDNIFKDMKFIFSEREIEQIISTPQVIQLPRSIYSKLLKWRKLHKRGDYNV